MSENSLSDNRDIHHTALPITATKKPYSVSELTYKIKEQLESNFGDIWVEGEVSNFRVSTSGHAYFKLKDAQSLLGSVIFKGVLKSIGFSLEDGQHIVARGHIDVFTPRGEYQLIIETAEPLGVGALQKAFEQLKNRLLQEGLFDIKYKKPIPLYPQRIVVVTSPTGAAIRDILHILNRRFANVHVVIYPVLVQGKEAAGQIATAITDLNKLGNYDVIILARGGGSLEDLWPFNEEVVARAIFASTIPIISAVGHEIDYTISDFVADLRAPTPSAAAELVVKNKIEVVDKIEQVSRFLRSIIEKKLDVLKAKTQQLSDRPVLARPFEQINRWVLYLDNITSQIHTQIKYQTELTRNNIQSISNQLQKISPVQKLKICQERIKASERTLHDIIIHRNQLLRQELVAKTEKLEVLSPLSILARGYSISYRVSDNRIIRSSSQLGRGDKVVVQLSEGKFTGKVEEIIP
ncbi:MAG: exodeoxyribonuclease VII large subunit [bacterium]